MIKHGWFFMTVAKIILLGLITVHYVPFILMLTRSITDVTLKYSYIKSIDLPTFGNTEAQEQLDYFSSLSYYPSVKYEGSRPIMIVEQTLYLNTLGLTSSLPGYCLIVLNKTMEKELFVMTLLHEYVHCFNYGHIENDPRDLMYPYDNTDWLEEQSIKKYSEAIGNTLRP